MNRRLQFANRQNWGESTVRAKKEKYDAEFISDGKGTWKHKYKSLNSQFLVYKMGVIEASAS